MAAFCSTEHVDKKPKNCELQTSQKLADGSSRVVFHGRNTQMVDLKDALIVSVDLPGVPREDVTIEVENGVLSIAAERPPRAGGSSSTMQKQHYRINEHKVDVDKLQAHLVDGVLTITLPKKEELKPIAISVAAHGPPDEQINNKDAGVWQFTCDLPGVKANAIQLELHERTLTLHATRQNGADGRTATTMDQKIWVNPTQVDTESIQGYLADGVLTLLGTRRPEIAKTKVVVPVSCGNTTAISSNPEDTKSKSSDESQTQDDNSGEESRDQDDLVLVETVHADGDEEE
jgi:HSP20 family protein